MNILTTILTGIVLFVVLIGVALVSVGAERFWGLFGKADLGPVAFEQLVRRSSANDALACPAGLCTAKSDITVPLYPVTAGQLRVAFAKVIASEPRVAVVESTASPMVDRYIQRSQLLGFPDTIVVRFDDRPNGQSTLAMYSRSQLGESDLGVNKARLERWLGKLATQVKPGL
jgi:uncharacterized protein (DUF1499 family)